MSYHNETPNMPRNVGREFLFSAYIQANAVIGYISSTVSRISRISRMGMGMDMGMDMGIM